MTSLGSVREAAIFTDLLFYPNVLGVTKWYLCFRPHTPMPQGRIGQVVANPSQHSYTFDMSGLFPGKTFRRLRGSAKQDPDANNGARLGPSLELPAKDALFLVP